MPTSNCYGCKKELAWGIAEPTSVLDTVYGKLGAFTGKFESGGASGSIAIGKLPASVCYFCAKCWAARMGVQESDVYSGGAPPAQTIGAATDGLKTQGISFACEHKAFMENDVINWPRCLYIYVHELVHWFSHNHSGFQPIGKTLWSANWDEMATDWIASNIFPMVATANYKKLTFYNNDFIILPDLLCQGFKNASELSNWKKSKWDEAAENAKKLNNGEHLLTALTTNQPKRVGWHWCRMYFSASGELEPFIKCFNELKSDVLKNEVKTIACETEYVAGCTKGLKRPVH